MLETSRLRLSEFTHSDTDFILSLLNSEGWLKYIGDRNVHSEEDAILYLDTGPLKSYRENGFGLWRVDLKDRFTPIGMCGLIKRPELDGPDIGFAFLPEYHQRGFASEAIAATIAHARDKLGWKELLAIVQPDNQVSMTILEKAGFKYVREVKAGVKMEWLRLYNLKLGG